MGILYGLNRRKGREMITVLEVAIAILTFESMPPKKLQKLCYYAYAWYLTLNKKYLFQGPFEAWIHGPVHPDLYQSYKEYGWMSIPQVSNKPDVVDDNIYEFLGFVYESYGEFSGDQLEAITHDEKPWVEARGSLREYEPSNNPINDTTIVDFYSQRLNGE